MFMNEVPNAAGQKQAELLRRAQCAIADKTATAGTLMEVFNTVHGFPASVLLIVFLSRMWTINLPKNFTDLLERFGEDDLTVRYPGSGEDEIARMEDR